MSTSGGISAGGVSVAVAHLTAAQISTMFSVPVTLVAAPAANTMIEVFALVYETMAGNSAWDVTNGGIFYAGDVANGEAINANLGKLDMLTNSSPDSQTMSMITAPEIAWDTATVTAAAVVVSQPTANPVRSAPIATTTLAAAGAGYVAGDTGTIDDPIFGAHATYVIDTVGALGIVVTYHLVNPGGAYDPTGSPYTTTAAGAQPGVGTGFQVNVVTLAAATGSLYVTAFYKTVTTH